MDAAHFDRLTKRLAQGRLSRRRLVTGVSGGLGGLLMLGPSRTEAVICRRGGVLCAKDAQCCSHTCDPTTFRCACLAGETRCGPRCCAADEVCTDVSRGACRVGPGPEACANPTAPCASNLTACGTNCSCITTTSGGSVCATNEKVCLAGESTCTVDSDCVARFGAGFACVSTAGCAGLNCGGNGNACVPVCST